MNSSAEQNFVEAAIELIRRHDGKQVKAAEFIGISDAYLSQVVKKERTPSARVQRLILDSLARMDAESLQSGTQQEPNARELPRLFKVPGVSWATAGRGKDFEDLCNQMEWEVETDCSDQNAFALEVDGSSMAPMFRHGEKIVVSPRHAPKEGAPAFVKLKDGRVFFKLYHETGEHEITLESANPTTHPSGKKKFEDLVIHKGDIAWIYPAWGRIERFL